MSPLEAAIERYRKRDWLPSDNAAVSWPIYDSSRQSIADAFALAAAYIEQLDTKQPWLDDAITQTRALSTLAANWDSYGAEPVSPGAIERAITLLTAIMKDSTLQKPGVSATPDGRVALMWEDLDIAVGEQRKEQQ